MGVSYKQLYNASCYGIGTGCNLVRIAKADDDFVSSSLLNSLLLKVANLHIQEVPAQEDLQADNHHRAM